MLSIFTTLSANYFYRNVRITCQKICNFVSGVILISLALCADAVIGNVQEKAMKAHKSSNTEVVSTCTIGETSVSKDVTKYRKKDVGKMI